MTTNYQVTCVCGHRFFVQEGGLNQPIACPQCHRALIPVTSGAEATGGGAGAAGGAVSAAPAHAAEPTERCPFCGETILAVARKCRFCNEYLDRGAPGGGAAAGSEEAAAEQEKKDREAPAVFTLSVSQWDNFWKFVICITLVVATGFVLHVFAMQYFFVGTMGAVVLMFFAMYFFFLAAKNARCVIRPARLETETGIFSKQTDNLELWRVIDIKLQQDAIERVLGIGTIYLKSSDEGTSLIELYKIPKAKKVFKYLQEQIPKVAKERGVVYIERGE